MGRNKGRPAIKIATRSPQCRAAEDTQHLGFQVELLRTHTEYALQYWYRAREDAIFLIAPARGRILASGVGDIYMYIPRSMHSPANYVYTYKCVLFSSATRRRNAEA